MHHESPWLPWYCIGARWQADRGGVLQRNGDFRVAGYGSLLRRQALRPIDPPVRPPICQPPRFE